MMSEVSFGQRITDLAALHPDEVAIVCGHETATWGRLDASSNRFARDLARHGVRMGDMVSIALPNSIEWFVAVVAAWKLGAIPQPVSARLPARELSAIVELADARVVLGVDPSLFADRRVLPVGYEPDAALGDGPLPEVVSPSWKATTSGGSTGRPKLIVSGDPAKMDPRLEPPYPYLGRRRIHLNTAPLYHNAPVVLSLLSLLWDNTVVTLPRFDAESTLAAIERHRLQTAYLVPTMMRRISRLDDSVRLRYDVSSLEVIWHIAEPCPPWLKAEWIDWLGAEKIIEIYGGTEGQAATIITGTEWIEHRGSVGRPFRGEIMIGDSEGRQLPVGETGEVWVRTTRGTPTYRYVGAEARRAGEGWESLGDIGYLDDDGYLYLCDRLNDMILVGGANVYPAEVESAIQEHPRVRSCCVIGLPDDDRGNRVHAIVEADADELDAEDLIAFTRERLAGYKVPRSIEFVNVGLRDDAGKVRRAALRAERLPAANRRT